MMIDEQTARYLEVRAALEQFNRKGKKGGHKMSHKNYMQASIAAIATLFTVAVFTVPAPSALSAPQTATNSNTKPGKTQTASPSRSTVVVKPTNSNRVAPTPTATNAKPSQPASPSRAAAVVKPTNSNKVGPASTAPKEASTVKKPAKVEVAGKTTYSKLPPHQYVIFSSDTGAYRQVAIQVRNEGKGLARAGTLGAGVVFLKGEGDPRKSTVVGGPIYECGGYFGSPFGCGWTAEAKIPALKPGETAEVLLKFTDPGEPDFWNWKEPTEPYKWGVLINARNGTKMADGELQASFKDFLSYAFFNK